MGDEVEKCVCGCCLLKKLSYAVGEGGLWAS